MNIDLKRPCLALAVPAALMCVSGLATPSDAAALKTITLKEQLNRQWNNELLSYPIEAKAGELTANGVSVKGPNGPVAAQLTDVQMWPGTKSVQSAKLLFVADSLAPLTTNEYVVSSEPAGAMQPQTDLNVKGIMGAVEVTSAKVGARLLVGDKTYDTPVAADQVPGPLLATRGADGNWVGGSKLYGDVAVKSWSAKVTETGPVEATVETTYNLANGTVATFDATVVAGNNGVLWRDIVTGDTTTDGITFSLGSVPGLTQIQVPKTWGQWGRPRALAIKAGGTPALLGPNSSVLNSFPDGGSTLILTAAGEPELRIASRYPGAWVMPAKPFTYGGYPSWYLDMIPKSWDNWMRKRMPVALGDGGSISMNANFASGKRFWSVGDGAAVTGERLNEVKDMILEWPDNPKIQNPRLFMTREEAIAGAKRLDPAVANVRGYSGGGGSLNGSSNMGYMNSGMDPQVATTSKVLKQLDDQLGALGDYDTMRYGHATVGMYDALIGSDLLTPKQRALYRAQMAYLGYVSADAMMWSIERGMHSGNPNMSASYITMMGTVAAAIPDHPMAKAWSNYTNDWLDATLTREVGPNGEWLPEGGHYYLVSICPIMTYAVVATHAGFHDFLGDPRIKKLALYLVKTFTPADPRNGNNRVTPSFGRGTTSDTDGVIGMLAKAYATSDPALSKTLQWAWIKEGYPVQVGDWRMGGFGAVYMDRTLPSQQPDWKSELFPGLGVIFRDGLGSPDENYVNIIATDDSMKNLDVWTPEVGNIDTWFAFGKPISKEFTYVDGYNERHELLHGGVGLTHNWGQPGDSKGPFGYYTKTTPHGFTGLPRADYVSDTYDYTTVDDREWWPDNMPAWPRVPVATKPQLNWTRQVLYMKGDNAGEPHYIVVRDTTSGGQPTTWQFWTLSNKIGTPDQIQAAAQLPADKPDTTIVGTSQLPAGDRFTALGQQGVDLDYYVASPTDTPRSTLRMGGNYRNLMEYQDLFHLQLPGDGTYFVAMYPRVHNEVAPTFSTVGDGKVIKVAGAFGTDYGFLSDKQAAVKADDAAFDGTAGSVQLRTAVTVLTLSAGGKVSYKGYALESANGAGLRVEGKTASVSIADAGTAATVNFSLPGKWKTAKREGGIALKSLGNGQYQLTAPAGVTEVRLAPA